MAAQGWYRLLIFSLFYMLGMLFLTSSLTMIIGFGYLGYSEETSSDYVCYANSTCDYPFRPNEYTPLELKEMNARNVSRRFQVLLRSGVYIVSIYLGLWMFYYTSCI